MEPVCLLGLLSLSVSCLWEALMFSPGIWMAWLGILTVGGIICATQGVLSECLTGRDQGPGLLFAHCCVSSVYGWFAPDWLPVWQQGQCMNAVPCPTPKACEARVEQVFVQTPASACGALKETVVCVPPTQCAVSHPCRPLCAVGGAAATTFRPSQDGTTGALPPHDRIAC